MKKNHSPISSHRMNRRVRATTLVEMLVVIVIFLVGILMVVQIFPGGFRQLALVRKTAQAEGLARSEMERLLATADGIPENVLPTEWALATNPSLTNLGPAGTSVDGNGNLFSTTGVNLGHWAFNSGANRFRLIESEHQRMGALRKVGFGASDYGCAFLPAFGPVENGYAQVSGNQLALETKIPTDLTDLGGGLFKTAATFGDFTAVAAEDTDEILVPTGPQDRAYRLWFTITATQGIQTFSRQLRGILVVVPGTTKSPTDIEYPLYRIDLQSIANANLVSGESLVSVDVSSLRIRRGYRQVGSFSDDPFEYRVLDARQGALLFNPRAASYSVPTGEVREPLEVVASYAVMDWRVLRQDMRITEADAGQYRLPLGSIKTDGPQTPDGTTVSALEMFPADTNQSPKATHIRIVDFETMGTVAEQDSATGRQLVVVDKVTGVIRFEDADPSTPALDAKIVFLTGGTRNVPIDGRTFRILYEAKEEWSMQLTRAAASYSSTAYLPTSGTYYVGGSNNTIQGSSLRVYFPAEDAAQVVSVGRLVYSRADGTTGELIGQNFTLRYRTGDPLNLPSLDIREAAPDAVGMSVGSSNLQGVKGVSIQVRVLYNPDQVKLTNEVSANNRLLDQWGRGWRKVTKQAAIGGGITR